MNVEFIILNDLPVQKIFHFEDKTVQNVAILTRERTKTDEAYPYLTGELERREIASPIIKSNTLEYSLSAGINYAKYVWNMENVNWTNKRTQPKWYLTMYKNKKEEILQNAVFSAIRSVK